MRRPHPVVPRPRERRMYPPRRAAADASDVGASSSTGSVDTSSGRVEWRSGAADGWSDSPARLLCLARLRPHDHIPLRRLDHGRGAASGSSSRRSRSRRTRSPRSTSSSARRTRRSSGSMTCACEGGD